MSPAPRNPSMRGQRVDSARRFRRYGPRPLEGRQCDDCRAKLSRYNDDVVCGPCRKKGRTGR